ncbi:MAG TPA: transglutaminase-like domain-containing protein [Anaeromyxobacteraceae bacterium]|nr:transglutaminase-like domain-containing protein [Anaeromyxobacteraceae bacterium]
MPLDSPARARFAALVARPSPPLDEAALAIAAEEYPALDPARWLAELDRLAVRVRARAPEPVRAAEALRALRGVLFEEEAFRGNAADYYDPRNSFLNEVLERRLGIPISLSLVAMEVARRAGLVLEGVGFPGHFLVKYAPRGGPEVYLDAYHGGELLSAEECVARFRPASHGGVDPRWLSAVTPHQILARVLHNLKRIYVQKGDDVRSWWVADRLVLVSPEQPEELRDRGLVAARLGADGPAARDLAEYLVRAPEASDVEEVRGILARLRSSARPVN